MKLKINKDKLLEALDKMCEVSTKGIQTEYSKGDLVTVNIEEKQIVFQSSNGHLDARWKLAEDTAKEDTGSFTVKSTKIRQMVNKLPVAIPSAPLIIDEDGDMLRISDPSRKRRLVKLQKVKEEHNRRFGKPKGGDSHTFETDLLSRGIQKVTPFMSDLGYKIKYLMLCLHFLKDETRFICGDGTVFAIFRFDDENPTINDAAGLKYIIPCNQSLIIKNLLGNTKKVTIGWGDPSSKDYKRKCYIQLDDGLELVLSGIPNEEYIAYDSHAFRTGDAKAIVDITVENFIKAVSVVGTCEDKERDKQGDFLSCDFEAIGDEVGFTVNEGKYQCDIVVKGDYYNLNGKSSFSSHYAHKSLAEIARASHHEYIRFFCIEEQGIVVAHTADLLDKKDERGVPLVKDEKTSLSFFFCAVDKSTEEDG